MVEDLAKIIANSSKILGVEISKDGSFSVAGRSRGTPRIANRLLRRARDWAQVHKIKIIDETCAAQALDTLGIDPMGLDDVDRKVIRALIEKYSGGPVGIESLAATLNEEVDTLVDAIEPYLLKSGFLKRTSRGREAMDLAYEHLGFEKRQKELF